jgi:hypothetical protein
MSVAVRLSKVVAALTDCVCDLLASKGGGPPCWCGFWPGTDVPWVGCGGECGKRACGMGYVTVNAVYPSSSFPTPDTGLTCTAPLAATLTVGALRCLPVGDGDGMPSDSEMLEVGLTVIADMAALREAIRCCLDDDYVLGAYTSLGPDGGCVGGQWTLTVALDG